MQCMFAIIFIDLFSKGIVRADLSKHQSSHVTGAVRIKRNSIPDPVIQCISESSAYNTEYCPRRVGNWSNVHCFNNSFGLYTPKSRFINIGPGPMGINLNSGYLQYLGYAPGRNPCEDEKDKEIQKKIEELIEERAKMETKANFFEKLHKDLEAEMEKLKQKLEKASEQKYTDSAKIKSLSMRLSRWEEGSAECENGEQNTLSAALEIASSHVAELEKGNNEYMDANKKLTDTVTSLRNSCGKMKTSANECISQLSECKTSLGTCEHSARESELSLEKQVKLHEKHVERAESEYDSIHNSLGLAREQLSECTSSLDAARSRNGELQKGRDEYINRLSKEITLLKQCNDDLQNCNANRSVSSNLHSECRSEIDKFSSRFSHMQDQYMKCTSNLDGCKKEVARLNDKNMNLSVAITNKDAELEKVANQNRKLEGRVSDLMKRFDDEATQHNEAKNDLLICQKELRNMTELNSRQQNMIAKADDNLQKLRVLEYDCVRKGKEIYRDLVTIKEKFNNMEDKFKKCQKQLDKYNIENDKLLSLTSSRQTELSSLKKTYDIVLKENRECMAKHNVSTQRLGDWKNQYLKCSDEAKNNSASLVKCNAKNEFLSGMIKSLEQEAETSLETNKKLAIRINKQTTIISDLTKSLTGADIKLNDLEDENALLMEKLENKQKLYLLKIQQYMNCSYDYSEALEKISGLEEDQLFSSGLMNSMREQTKDTSDQLMQAQKSLEYNKAMLQEARNAKMSLQTKLKSVQELYDNERDRRLAVDKQLLNCRSNHTGTLEESYAWQSKLEACRERISEVIGTQEKDFQKVEKQLGDLTESYENAIEAHRQMNSSLHYCQKQQQALQGEQETLRHKVSECGQKLHITFKRTQHIVNVKMILQQRLETCSSEHDKCKKLLNVQKEKFNRCSEQAQGIQLELEFTSAQLDQCNAECKKSSLACPEGPAGETYVITSSGCLMQTPISGSEKEIEKYCNDVSGQLLTLEDKDKHLNKDIMQMFEYSGAKATLVWVSPPNKPEHDCFSADMSKLGIDITKPVEYSKTSCAKILPGICFTSLNAMSSSQTGIDDLLPDVGMTDEVAGIMSKTSSMMSSSSSKSSSSSSLPSGMMDDEWMSHMSHITI